LLSRFEAKDGKPTLFLGSSVSAHTQAAHEGERGMAPQRRYALLKGETARKRLGPPRCSDLINYWGRLNNRTETAIDRYDNKIGHFLWRFSSKKGLAIETIVLAEYAGFRGFR